MHVGFLHLVGKTNSDELETRRGRLVPLVPSGCLLWLAGQDRMNERRQRRAKYFVFHYGSRYPRYRMLAGMTAIA